MSTPACSLALSLGCLVSFPYCDDGPTHPASTPPVARREPKVTRVHGEERTDDYDWLRQRGSPDVLEYLEAENAYTDAMTRPLRDLQETLYREMLGRLREDDVDPPHRDGRFLYFTRHEKGKAYTIYCRKAVDDPDAPEQVILDLNPLAEGKPFLGTSGYAVSDDGRHVAYTLDETGYRINTLWIKDLQTGEYAPERIRKVRTWVWADDDRTLLYTIEDDAKRSYRAYRHKVGTDPKDDALLFEEPDETYRVSVRKTRDRKYLLVATRNAYHSEYRAIPADRPEEAPRLILDRHAPYDAEVDHRGDRFYLRTNLDAPEFRLVTAPDDDLAPASWAELAPARPGQHLRNVTLFADHAVLQWMVQGQPAFEVLDLNDAAAGTHPIAFPEGASSAFADANPEFRTTLFRYRYQSLINPPATYDHDMATGQSHLVRKLDVPGGHDPSEYISERIWATAPDGTTAPILLAYKKTTPHDGSAPLLLYGYGAYGALTPPNFQAPLLSLLDRGVIYAIAQVRGGGDLGKAWHEDGKLLHKKNTFTDFIACAEHLVAEKYTRRDKLAIRGLSAGGLLIGAVLNERPDLCRAAVLEVPFVDAINTMLDVSIPLTGPEFLEWGNPAIKEQYDYMKTYCPYTNLRATAYPATLVRGSYHDSQVQYWEPAKYVAKMRTLRTDHGPLLLKTNMTAGHSGASGRYDNLRETAFLYAFILDQVGARD
jgi:oligopeptidase B